MAALIDVYNEALRLLGERRLASTSEARDVRYHLDDAFTKVKAYCLEQGFWNFAMRAVQIDHSATLTPSFGYAYAFEKPSDWVRTYVVSTDGELREWLNRFNDENGIWYADFNPLFAKYVSNDSSYGGDLAKWPETFSHYVACRLALEVGPTISSTSEQKTSMLLAMEKKAKIEARNKDAMNEPSAIPPGGTWVRARGSYYGRGLEPWPGRTIG